MSDTIGDNSLIHRILANRIAETPTVRVPEVEPPEPEVEEEKPPQASREVDYSEYETEPAPPPPLEEVAEKTALVKNNLEEEEAKERQANRRQISIKWGVQLYDQLQGLIAIFTYDKLNSPQDFIDRRRVLLQKVYDGKISKEERTELQKVNEVVDKFLQRRSDYQNTVQIAEELKSDINQLLDDILVASKMEINPIWILVILMLVQPVINLITSFTHKMQYNTRF